MIVARFTVATGWLGKCITFDEGQFALEGNGLLAPQDVLRYDQLGQIAWEHDGLRDWVDELATAGGVASGVADPAPHYVSPASPAADQRPSGESPAPAALSPAAVPPAAPVTPLSGYSPGAQYVPVPRQASPPGIAVAGFVLALVAFVFPIGVLWWVGLALSWAGYRRARSESLPSGLALAGLIINAVMTVVSVIIVVLVIVAVAVS